MRSMFGTSTLPRTDFDQNLCAWKAHVPSSGVQVSGSFYYTSCPNENNPSKSYGQWQNFCYGGC